MASSPPVFQSRVGRRVLLLFLAAGLLPLAAMALLSLSQVRALLLQQAGNRMAGMAKAHAVGIHDRLLVARDVAELAARGPRADAGQGAGGPRGETPQAGAVAPQFRWLARVDPQGGMVPLRGNPPAQAAGVAAGYREGSRWPRPSLERPASGGVILSIALDAPRSKAAVVGEIDPAFLWGDPEERKAGLVVCVVDGGTLAALYCPGGEAMDLPGRLRRAPPPQLSEDVSWQRDGALQRGRVWGQFLTNDFGIPDWYVAMSLPEDDLLAAVNAFRDGFVPAVVLALLLTTLLSVNQIRAVLVPLAGLTEGTRRVAAGDFAARVPTGTRDEFGELGDAFNAMSARLGRQRALSVANAEIDRLILERYALERMVECVLMHAKALLPRVRLRAVVLDGRGAARGRMMVLGSEQPNPRDGLVERLVDLPESVRPPGDAAAPFLFQRPDRAPAWLAACEPVSDGAVWIQPLTWGATTCGWLVAIAGGALEEDDRMALREFGRRLAVGIASAWSDEELYQRAHFDPLTGLPNRRMFSDRLALEMVRCEREGDALAVLFVDLDRFKAVNDSQGHGAGDALLCEAAARIRTAVREDDTVSRHGGDEFTVLLTGLHDQADALVAARHVIEALSAPFVVAGSDCFLSASVGIAMFPENGRTAEVLIERSDTAMYRAKAAGRGRAMFFEERMNAEAAERLSMDRDMRLAIERSELVLHFQPQVDLEHHRMLSAEALVRWNHPERGMVPPGQFIGLAEEGGLIRPIGRWVIEETCRHVALWRDAGLGLDRVSLNVSGKQLAEADFVDFVNAVVVEPGLASRIEFEITETALIERGERVERVLDELSGFGIHLALDDFGTGFSSMAYLKRLPVDVVKIDRLFVEDIDRSPAARAFVQAMIAMSHALGKRVVAEGAEREDQVAVLRELGCDLVQGFFFSRPLPAEAFVAMVSDFGRPALERAIA